MNLVENLLKMNEKKADELSRGIFRSKRLAKMLGTETETVDVEIQEINSRRLNDIASYQMDRKGAVDYSRAFDAKLMVCVEGCLNPDLRNKDLQEHFHCKSAKDLAEKLFRAEVTMLSDAITELSGITGDEDAEIKN